MARRLTLDTSFLIDLQRERWSGKDGSAHHFLASEDRAELALSTVALGEIAAGCRDPGHPFLQLIRSTLTLLPVDEETAIHYGVVPGGSGSRAPCRAPTISGSPPCRSATDSRW